MHIDADDAEIRVERREWVVGDLRARARDRADESRLARVRQPEQPNICEHSELELELAAVAGLARSSTARRAIGARLEVYVAQPTAPPAREQGCLIVPCEIRDDVAGFTV